jgi:preprotein translocase subunit SecA
MLKTIVQALFGTRHQRELKRLAPIIEQINEEFERLQSLSDDELRGQTERFRAMIRDAVAEVEAELAELREEKRQALAAAEREGIAQRIGEAEERRKEALEGILDEILPKRSPP